MMVRAASTCGDLLAAFGLLLCGLGSSVSCPGGTPSAATPADAAPSVPSLVVSGRNGIREVGLDGTVLRTLTSTPAGYARWLPGRRELVFLAPETGELRAVSAEPGATSAERVVAVLPRTIGVECGGIWGFPFDGGEEASYDPVAAVQSDSDFALTADGRTACLTLMDRNVNMVNVMVVVGVELATGAERHAIVFSPSCGETTLEEAEAAVGCSDAVPFVVGGSAPPLEAEGAFPPQAELTFETASPSGRWAFASAHRDESDYIYRLALLVEQETGAAFPVTEGSWPAPLHPEQLASADVLAEATITVTGESTVRWLGQGDMLIVGGLLVVPGERIVALHGEVVW